MLLKELSQAFGVSGYEKEIRELIKAEVKDYADEIITDAMGNLIVYKKGEAPNKKKIMMAAHMDEIGLQVTKLENNGQIKVKTLGFLWLSTTYMSRVKFRNGIIGIAAGHIEEFKNDFNRLYIDIGAKSKEEAAKYVKLGDVASYIGEYIELKNDNVAAKAMDNRIGCYIIIRLQGFQGLRGKDKA
jgi:endoglucanase